MRKIEWVPLISEYYQRLADEQFGREVAMVSTPFPLSKDDKKLLIKTLSSITGKKISLNEKIDSSLIAGLSVRIGSTIFDGSLSNQLQRIEKEICNAS